MASSSCNYRPGGYSDEESSFDEFDWDDGFEFHQRPVKAVRSERDETEDALRRAITDGNLTELEEELRKTKIVFDINEPLSPGGYTLLMCACQEAQPEIVQYLIEEKEVVVNTDLDSFTPLMIACRSDKDSNAVAQVVKLLLEGGAVINQSSKFGDTPLIFACQNKHIEVVSMLINEASLDATNNQTGNSAIFYAIEKNSVEIVQMLLEKGAQYKIANRRGYLPKNVAEIYGFQEIISLFPQDDEDQYAIPIHYTSYSHYSDLVPGILGDSRTPPYFHRVGSFLSGLELTVLHEVFAQAEVGMTDILNMNEEDFERVGVKLPILQKKLLHGLFQFHGHEWNKKAVPSCRKKRYVDTYAIYLMLSGHLEHLTVMNCGIKFVLELARRRNLTPIKPKDAAKLAKAIIQYQQHLDELYIFMDKVANLSHQELIDEINARKVQEPPKRNQFLNKFLTYTSIISFISIVATVSYLKFK